MPPALKRGRPIPRPDPYRWAVRLRGENPHRYTFAVLARMVPEKMKKPAISRAAMRQILMARGRGGPSA